MLTLEELKTFAAHQEKVHSELYNLLKNFAAINTLVGQTYNVDSYLDLARLVRNASITDVNETEICLEWEEYWNYGGYEHHRFHVAVKDLLNPEEYKERLITTQENNKHTFRKKEEMEAKKRLAEELKTYEKLKKKFEVTNSRDV